MSVNVTVTVTNSSPASAPPRRVHTQAAALRYQLEPAGTCLCARVLAVRWY